MLIVVVVTVFRFDKTIVVVSRERVSAQITDPHPRSIPNGGYSPRSDGPVESPESTLRSSAVYRRRLPGLSVDDMGGTRACVGGGSKMGPSIYVQ